MKRRCNDHRVVRGEGVALCERKPGFIYLDGNRLNRQKAEQRGQQGMGVRPTHLHIAPGDIGQLRTCTLIIPSSPPGFPEGMAPIPNSERTSYPGPKAR